MMPKSAAARDAHAESEGPRKIEELKKLRERIP